MNRFLLLTLSTLSIFALSASNASAQSLLQQLGREFRDQGRQAIEREFRPQPQNPQHPDGNPQSRTAIPSESGRDSGGGGRFTNPGNDFALPGRGQPIRPGYTAPDQFAQPWRPVNPNQPVYQGGREIYQNGQRVYHDNQSQSGGTSYTQPAGTSFASTELPSSPVATNQYVVIRCPKSTAGSIYYSLDSNRGRFGFTLSPGQEQRFRVGTKWAITYNDGAEQKRYKLDAGKIYTMKIKSDNRWQIYANAPVGS